MADTSEVVIIGGGAAGCATAYYLGKAGIKSTIVEREGISSQASGFSAGGLNPLQGAGIPGPLAPLAMESFELHKGLAEDLKQETGVDIHYKVLNMVNIAFTEADFPALDETLGIFEKAEGFSAHMLSPKELHELDPRVNIEAIRGLNTRGNVSINSYDYTVALSKAAESMGATIRQSTVTGLKTDGDKVTGVTLDNGEIDCENVVVASGPWSGDAGKWLGVDIPVVPLKGEIVRVKMADSPLEHDFSGPGASLYQRADGLVWIGATEADEGFSREPTQAAQDKLINGALQIMPSISDAQIVKHTACLRPVTSDWLPIVGTAPGWQNVYLATGAGKKGILISPGIGKSTADLISSGQTDLSVEAFSAYRW